MNPDRQFNQAFQQHQKGQLAAAQQQYQQILQQFPKHFLSLRLLGTLLFQQKQYEEATHWIKQALAVRANDSEAHNILGAIFHAQGQLEAALPHFAKSYELATKSEKQSRAANIQLCVNGLYQQAVQLYNERKYLAAAELVDRTLKHTQSPAVLNLAGVIALELNQYEKARDFFKQVLKQRPEDRDALNNMVITAKYLKDFTEGLVCAQQLEKVASDFADGYCNKGILELEMQTYEAALKSFDRALELNPKYVQAWNSRGNACKLLKKYDDALQSYDTAIGINAAYPTAYANKAALLLELRRSREAEPLYQKALALNPRLELAYTGLAEVAERQKEYGKAVNYYQQLFTINPHFPSLLGKILRSKQQAGAWQDVRDLMQQCEAGINAGQYVVDPFEWVGASSSPASLLACAQIYAKENFSNIKSFPTKPLAPLARGQKLKIAYLSANFCEHAVAYVMAELFELHNRDQFEVIAYSFSPKTEGEMTARLQQAFDHFYNVKQWTDLQIAEHLRDQGVHIAVDLMGYTTDCRTNVFAYQPAPVQIAHIGYPGSMGAPFIQYLVADSTLIPQEEERFYSEKILKMPSTYQPNDRKRKIAHIAYTREQAGLPEGKMIYCCFNNNYKINEATFSVWMDILKAVPDSVLWLLKDNEEAGHNYKKYAQQAGVDPERIILAGRVPLDQHLARYRMADLVLDNLPYNGHATTSDALWAGIPVLTCKGSSFAGRVASSLLQAANMPELITNNMVDYFNLAVKIGQNVNYRTSLREKLAQNIPVCDLFNTPEYVKELESLYLKAWQETLNSQTKQPA